MTGSDGTSEAVSPEEVALRMEGLALDGAAPAGYDGAVAGGSRGEAVKGTHIARQGLRIEVEGDGFLYNQVRILAGTLLEVGCGLKTVEDVAALVAPASASNLRASGVENELRTEASREMSGPTLAAENLCLEHVEYDMPHPAASLASNTTPQR
jgi:tRNA U38,U39,U40 pseudouridine synthase TruA